ncbi:MAG: hydrogenase [Elusimicrobiota bacterium]
MNSLVEMLIVLIILINLYFLVSNRIAICIKLVALQGFIIGFLILIINGAFHLPGLILSAATILLKGIVFPILLFRALREAEVKREVEVFVSYSASVLIGIISLAVSFWLVSKIYFPIAPVSTLMVSVAFSTIFIGIFIIISRVKALTQVLGYLILENGICLLGISLLLDQPIIVEMGILLDVFVAIFVMGITIFHIQREFEHIDTHKLSKLSDVPDSIGEEK